MSFMESELMRLGNKKQVNLSEMFIVRKAYELKAEKFIRMDGKINFGQGGAFHDIPFVIKNFGIVPYEIYKGKLDSKSVKVVRGLTICPKPYNVRSVSP